MPDILEITEAGMRNQLRQLDTISRNVANINTQSYKREIYLHRGFDSYLSGAGAAGDAGADTSIDFRSGPLRRTGSALNVAIEGNGFFQLQTAQGTVLTRDGQFRIDAQGQLTALDGSPVLTRGNATLDENLQVRADGTIIGADHAQVQLDIVEAAPQTLQQIAPGRYTAMSTSAPEPGSYHLRQGFLESSNVDYLKETVDMMGLVRNVQSSQQLLRAYDEMLDSAISTLGQF